MVPVLQVCFLVTKKLLLISFLSSLSICTKSTVSFKGQYFRCVLACACILFLERDQSAGIFSMQYKNQEFKS